MKNELWEKVEQIFQSALDLPPEDRNSYLERECAGEGALFSEVQSLLHSFERDSGFLDEPVFELGLEAFGDKPEKDLAGLAIGFYKLEKKIGAGGMGEVYKALDTRLNRYVALKFLSGPLQNDGAAKRQLVKEAQAVAMLEHPNICAVHGIDQTDEHDFIVMQYIEGKTLAESFAEREIDIDEFKAVARQIISAVAFAHSHGVIHRDLKPGNIMLTPDGQIKVLDFGLAKIIPRKQLLGGDSINDVSRFSQNGLIMGTVSYMSPEQLRGDKLDYQTDIFSIGIILYELLAKKNPFNRDSPAETIAAILANDPPPLKNVKINYPKGLTDLIEKCLAKDRIKRIQSAAEILVELDKTESPKPARRTGSLIRAGAAIVVLFVIWLTLTFYTGGPSQRTLAVMPFSFADAGAEKEYLADGLTQSIIDRLSLLPAVKVKSEFLVSRFKGKSFDTKAAGRELNVDAVLTGTIVNREGLLMLAMNLTRVSDGFVIYGNEILINESNLIELQENIVLEIASRIKSDLTDDDKGKLVQKETNNGEAKRLYIHGRFYLGRRQGDDLKNAERCFRQATDLDPLFAKAWAGLADTYTLLAVPGYKGSITPDEALKSARAAAKYALEIDDSLCEPYVSLGMIKLKYEWDWAGAESHFRAAISRNPEFPAAYLGLSNLLIIQGRFDEALEAGRKARELAPFSVSSDLNLIGVYYFKRDFEKMDTVLSDSLENFPNHKRLNYFRGLEYLATGRSREATEIFEAIYQEDKVLAAAPLGLLYGRTGRKEESMQILAHLEELTKNNGSDYIPSQEKAIIYLGLGQLEKVFDYLNKACTERFPAFPFVVSDPIFDEIRPDSRSAQLRKCARL